MLKNSWKLEAACLLSIGLREWQAGKLEEKTILVPGIGL
jgi:hypothetical protein